MTKTINKRNGKMTKAQAIKAIYHRSRFENGRKRYCVSDLTRRLGVTDRGLSDMLCRYRIPFVREAKRGIRFV